MVTTTFLEPSFLIIWTKITSKKVSKKIKIMPDMSQENNNEDLQDYVEQVEQDMIMMQTEMVQSVDEGWFMGSLLAVGVVISGMAIYFIFFD